MWWEYVGMRQTGLCRWQRYVIMVPLSNVLLNCNEGFCFFMFLLILILSLVWCKCSWFVTLVWLLVQMCIISPTIGCWQISRSACPLFQRKLVSAHGISQWSHSHSDHTLAHGFDWKSDIAQKSVKIPEMKGNLFMGKNMRSGRHQIENLGKPFSNKPAWARYQGPVLFSGLRIDSARQGAVNSGSGPKLIPCPLKS